MMLEIEYEHVDDVEKRLKEQYKDIPVSDRYAYMFGAMLSMYQSLCAKIEICHNEKLKTTTL